MPESTQISHLQPAVFFTETMVSYRHTIGRKLEAEVILTYLPKARWKVEKAEPEVSLLIPQAMYGTVCWIHRLVVSHYYFFLEEDTDD